MRLLRLVPLALLAACGNNAFVDAPGARALAVDESAVTWLSGAQDPKLLQVAAKEPGDPRTLATGAGASGSVLADDGESFFWVAGGKIQSAPRAGGAAKTVATEEHVTLVAAGPDAVYWVTGEPSDGGQQLKKVAKAGGDVQLLASSERFVRALAADASGVFWTSADETGGTNGQVRHMSPVSGEPQSIVRGLGRLTALVVAGDTLYVASGTSLSKAPATGGQAETLGQVAGLEVQALAKGGQSLYALALSQRPDEDHPDLQRQSALYKLPAAGGSASAIAEGLVDASAVGANAGAVYWLQPDRIFSIAAQ